MKKNIFFIFILVALIAICLGLFALKNIFKEHSVDESSAVYIRKTENGYQLYRNGKPFYIKGASGDSYLKELAEIGGNTIRLYDTINLVYYLDEAKKNGLAVIVDIPMPNYKYYRYLSKEYISDIRGNVQNLVKKHKNHPALLIWNLGNELNYPVVFRKNKFIENFNEIVDLIHLEDPDHPVSTTIFRKREAFALYLHSPELDLIGLNVFGDLKNLNSKLSKIFFLTKPKPYYISEWGNNGYWEEEMTIWGSPIEPTSTKKGEQFKERYGEFIIPDQQCLGSLAFYWGYKYEMTNTWFNIFDEKGRKSKTYYVLKSLWTNTINNIESIPEVLYMLVDERGSADNIIFESNKLINAELRFIDHNNDSIIISWEICPETWDTRGKESKPKQIKNSIMMDNNNLVTFKTPIEEGPYRIFAYIYDFKGNFATANTPFYVLNPK